MINTPIHTTQKCSTCMLFCQDKGMYILCDYTPSLRNEGLEKLELLTLLEGMSSPPVVDWIRVAQFLVLVVVLSLRL